MNSNAMYNTFLILAEGGKMYNVTPNVREVEKYLNLAQLQLIKKRYAKWKNRAQIGYGDSEIRNAELAGLVTATKRITRDKFIQGTADNGALPGPNRDATVSLTNNQFTYNDSEIFGVFVPVPDEALYILYESSSTTANINGNQIKQWNVTVRNISYEQYNNEIFNYYKNPYGDTTWSMDWGSYTTGVLGTGSFGESTKTNSTQGTYQNMIGYAPIVTGGTLLTVTTTPTTIGNYYQLRITGNATLNYKSVTYTSSSNNLIILADGANTYTTTPGTGTAGMYDITAKINTDRSKYVLTGKGWYLVEYTMSYIKTPRDIIVNLITPALQQDCELADFLHEEIVKEAVQLYSGSIVPEPNKYEVNSMETTKQE